MQMQLTFDGLASMLKDIVITWNAGVFLLDKDKNITDWNNGAQNITGYTRQAVVGKAADAILHMENRKTGEAIFKNNYPLDRVFQDGETIEFNKTMLALTAQEDSRVLVRCLISPVVQDSEVIGALVLFFNFDDHDHELDKFKRLAYIDVLTNLNNRRALLEILPRECTRALRYARPLSMLFIDIDNFKDYNDEYGHIEGDKVLVRIGEILAENLRSPDFLFRFGGEEFIVLLPETPTDAAYQIADRLRKVFVEQNFYPEQNKGSVHKTISIGVATLTANCDAVTFIDIADKAMYQAKKEGKNKVCIYSGAKCS
jgi:diguanylate cyclase (GGDEF)-like protein